MNKNFKIITINGTRGMLTVIFIVLGLIAGFIISPGWVCMHIWNYIFHNSNIASLMNIYQGIMLWAVIALSVYALNGKKSLIGFEYYRGLSNEQIQNIVESVNAQDTDLSQEIEEINRVIKKVSEAEKSNMPAQKIGGKINMRQMTEKEKFEPKKTENKTEYEQSAQHGSQEENAGR